MSSQFVQLPKVSGGGGGGGGGSQIAGKINIPSQSGFASGPTQVLFTSANTEFDTGSVVGTNALVAPETAYYTCVGSAYSPTNSSFIVLYYQVNNGSLYSFAPTISGTGASYAATGGAFQIKLNAGDQLKFYIFAPQNDAGNILFSMIKG